MPRGGIRIGAGRPRRRRRIGDCLRLNAHRIQRLSMWVRHRRTWQTRRGEVTVDFSRDPRGMDAIRDGSEERIVLDYTHPPHGGERMWFLCPSCDRRCRDIYMPLDHYLWGCRICLNLSYATENESRFDRLLTKKLKLQSREARCSSRQIETRTKLRHQIMRVDMQCEQIMARMFPGGLY